MRRATPASTRQRRAVHALVVGLMVVSACGGAGAALDAPDGQPSTETVAGVGRLPATIPAATSSQETSGPEITVEVTLPPIEGEQIGTVAAGNRLLMVGDSLFAGVSRRFSNKACDRLNPLGWDVLVEAEPGRFIDFGRRVLDRRLDEGWDALVLMFGSNYRHDRTSFRDTLGSMIDDAGDIPVVLLTTSLFREAQREVNEVITTFGLFHDHVTIVDWEGISAIPGVLSRDRIHPTDQGQEVMVAAIAQVLGDAPPPTDDERDGERAGECLRAVFTDDSAIGRGTGTGTGTGSGTGSGTQPPSPSTTRPPGTSPPPTTAAPTGTPPPSSDAPSTAPAPTDPPPTAPPPTDPPPTSPPPATVPPATAPPATSAPEPTGTDDG